MNLVIVESPTKARTIGRFLGKDFEIKASMGHIMDLPKSKLGVDLEHNFKPQFEMMPDKAKVVADLKKAAKTASTIILATDPDREGEAIAAHVKEVLEDKKNADKFKRMVFHEITKEAIEEAIQTPRKVDENLVDAQIARRVLDRLVGYKLSPLLWQKVRRGLSAGRVQSVALRLIVEREKEIDKFKKEPYYTIAAALVKSKDQKSNTKDEAIPFELITINNEKIELQETFNLYDGEYKITKTNITTQDRAEKIVADVQPSAFVIKDVTQKETKRSPQPPYTTSTLQQDASRRLGLPGRRTMSIAQKLYEEGYITYHRTDSVAMAHSAQGSIIGYVKKEFGEKYVQPRAYTTKQKLAQEAHEAIRPTKVGTNSTVITQDLGAPFGKLYELIWRRAVASQMSDAITESTTVLAEVKANDIYGFKANGSVLVFDGFLRVNPGALQDTKLPEFTTGESLKAQQVDIVPHETSAPPRYNDASLIKTLEEKGIGRPSTYATIISTIEDRKYVERAESRFVPTAIGNAVNEFLVEHFADIDDVPFTADMEDLLDEVANGEKKWEPMIANFYKPFEEKLVKVKDAKRVAIAVETTDEKCPKCGNPLVIRTGRFGKFLSCSTFPECDFKKAYIEETGLICPKDGGKVIARKTRKGRVFYGCSNYPACDFASWKLEDIPGAPQREGVDGMEGSPAKKFIRKPNFKVKKHVVKRGKVKTSKASSA